MSNSFGLSEYNDTHKTLLVALCKATRRVLCVNGSVTSPDIPNICILSFQNTNAKGDTGDDYTERI